ncbi:hypothetical protein SRHO_G00048380, partial [Serrasalmus rhombeus]
RFVRSLAAPCSSETALQIPVLYIGAIILWGIFCICSTLSLFTYSTLSICCCVTSSWLLATTQLLTFSAHGRGNQGYLGTGHLRSPGNRPWKGYGLPPLVLVWGSSLRSCTGLVSLSLDYLNCIQTNAINAVALLVTLATGSFCPDLKGFWEGYFTTMSTVLGVNLQPCPLIAIFGIPDPSLALNSTQKDIIAFTSLLARRTLLLYWKSVKYPSISRWLKDVMFF